MSLVFAAITPHPPFLIPAIGKEATAALANTQAALAQLEQELYLSRPQVIMIVSPHTSYFADAFSVNAHTNFISQFNTFGDIITKKSWKGAPDLAAKIAHTANPGGSVPIRLVSEEKLDYGASVPLYFLTEHLPECKILPLGFSNASTKEHLQFGEIIKEICMDTDTRVALIASGDLAHTLTKNSPAGYHPHGAQFDTSLQELLTARNSMGIASLPEDVVKNADQCGYRSILILLGAIKNMDYQFKSYCYEAPFGIGYLTGNFIL